MHLLKLKNMKSSKKEQIPVEYNDSKDYNNELEEKEAFLYTSIINASNNFSKYI